MRTGITLFLLLFIALTSAGCAEFRSLEYGPFVRDPLVQSIEIHKFSYRKGDGPPIVLLSNYAKNFWMQDNPRYETRELPAVLYLRDGSVTINISFRLISERYGFDGEMPAREKSQVLPTVIFDQGVRELTSSKAGVGYAVSMTKCKKRSMMLPEVKVSGYQ